jgi:hypothetical protein
MLISHKYFQICSSNNDSYVKIDIKFRLGFLLMVLCSKWTFRLVKSNWIMLLALLHCAPTIFYYMILSIWKRTFIWKFGIDLLESQSNFFWVFLLSMNEVNIKYWFRDFQKKFFYRFSGRIRTFYRRKTNFYEKKISVALPSAVISWLSKWKFCPPDFWKMLSSQRLLLSDHWRSWSN